MEPREFIGRQIREYRILDIIGQGGMAAVLKAEHIKLKTTRAIKVIREQWSRNPKFIERFNREARLLVRLKHPNLVQIHDFFEEEGFLFLVMEYVAGESLAARLKHRGILPVKEILPIVIQALEGLKEAHKMGIVHRDISPDNIMLMPMPDGSERVVIIDFGIAKSISEPGTCSDESSQLTVAGGFLGKLAYCSPEQAGGLPIDGRSDLYSLALVLHRSLTGSVPFKSTTPVETLALRRMKAPPLLKDAFPGGKFSKELEAVVQKALARDPDKRFQTAGEFISALKVLLPKDVTSTDVMQTIVIDDETSFMVDDFIETEQREKTIEHEPAQPSIHGKNILLGLILAVLMVIAGVVFGLKYQFLLKSSPKLAQTSPKSDSTPLAMETVLTTPSPEVSPAATGLFLMTETSTPPPTPVKKRKPRRRRSKHTPTPMKTELQTPSDIPKGFAWVPPGTFVMGSPDNETGHTDIEMQHNVILTNGYFVQKNEVSQAEWTRIMKSNPSYFKGTSLPVENITWFDAIVYCNRLSREEGLHPCYYTDPEFKSVFDKNPPILSGSVFWDTSADGYRLPTEAEWEYFCRAGTQSPFNTGDQLSTDNANFNGNLPYPGSPKGVYRGLTVATDSFGANAFGLKNMHGNVWEWCWDHETKEPTSTDTTDPVGPTHGNLRITRGGCWNSSAVLCRSANRYWVAPNVRNNCLGFRVVKTVFKH